MASAPLEAKNDWFINTDKSKGKIIFVNILNFEVLFFSLKNRNGTKQYKIVINPIAKYEALDWIIDIAVIARVIIINPNTFVLFRVDLEVKNNTKGILRAIENAAIFLLAVTPIKFPDIILPSVFIISMAWKKMEYVSIARIKVKIHEKKLLFFFIEQSKIVILMYIKNTLNCLEIFTKTSVEFIA